MRRIHCIIWLALLMALGLMPSSPVFAETLHYRVAIQQPSNQIDHSLGYFALRVAPNTAQQLTITITNQDARAHRYLLAINRATTNANGAIDYTNHANQPRAGLAADLAQMATVPASVTVPAKATQTVPIRLHTPPTHFAGLVLGGLQVQEVSTAAAASGQGVQLHNQFAYVIGIALQEDASYAALKPQLVLRGIKAQLHNDHNSITINLANLKPNLIHQLKLAAIITKQGHAKPVLTSTKANMTMAPNSTFAYPLSTQNQPLQAGHYRLQLTASASGGKYQWHFTKAFTITNARARRLNQAAVDLKRPAPPWGLYLMLGAVLGLLLIAIFLARDNLRHKRRH